MRQPARALRFPSAAGLLLVLLTALIARPADAQDAPNHAQAEQDGLCTLVSEETLGVLLPQRFGAYVFDQTSLAPSFEEPPQAIALNAVYEAEGGKTLFVVLSHYCPARRAASATHHAQRALQAGEGREATYRDYRMTYHSAYELPDRSKLVVDLGQGFEMTAYGNAGAVPMADLWAALEAVDLTGLEALVASPATPQENVETAPTASSPAGGFQALLPETLNGFSRGPVEAGGLPRFPSIRAAYQRDDGTPGLSVEIFYGEAHQRDVRSKVPLVELETVSHKGQLLYLIEDEAALEVLILPGKIVLAIRTEAPEGGDLAAAREQVLRAFDSLGPERLDAFRLP